MHKQTMDSAVWLLIYSMLWYLLSGNNGWYFGLPLVILATFLANWLQLTPWYLHPRQVLPFAAFFFTTMLAGAWDVARRALHPHRPLEPAWVSYSLQSRDRRVCLVCSAVVGLLPGTLASDVDGQQMHLHVLDAQQDWQTTLRQLEQRLERLLVPVAARVEC